MTNIRDWGRRAAAGMSCSVFLAAAAVSAQDASPPATADEVDQVEFLYSLDQELMQMVVTATRTEQRAGEAPAVITVIGHEQLRRANYRTVADALAHVPGLYVVDDLIVPSVQVRGFSGGARGWSRGVKIMIDNQPISFRSDATVDTGLSLIPITAIERIEIIRGPASALYGANAFLGVVNIITRRGGDVRALEVTGRAGTLAQGGAFAGEAVYGTQEEGLEVFAAVSAGSADRSGLTLPASSPITPGDTTSQRDMSRPLNVLARAGIERDWGNATLSARLGRTEANGEFSDWSQLTHRNLFSRQSALVRGETRFKLGDTTNLTLAGVYADGAPTSEERLAPLSKEAPYYIRRDLHYRGVDLSAELASEPLENFSVTGGLDLAVDRHRLPNVHFVYIDQGGPATRPGDQKIQFDPLPDQTFLNLGAYTQLQYAISRFQFTGGVRYDHHNLYDGVFNYRLGVVSAITDRWFAKLLYGTSYKAPAPSQLYTRPLVSGDLLGNADLKPERAQTMELNVSGNAGSLGLSATTFVSRLTDKTGVVEADGNLVAVNLTGAWSYGAEVEARARTDLFDAALLLDGFLNLAYQYTTLDPERAGDRRRFIDVFPPLLASAGGTATVPGLRAALFAELRFVGERLSSFSNELLNGSESYVLPPHLTLDLTLSSVDLKLASFGETYIAASVRNVTDADVVTPGYAGVDYPGFGRTYELRLTQSF